mgnify:FL=1
MINDIEKLKIRSSKYIKEFMQGCTIEEKIDTHYITIDIISRNAIVFKKANGNEIDRVDLILNSMWNKLFLDWNYLKLSNANWFSTHVGYTIKMFYFPCATPILTQYDENIRYIFDKVIYNGHELNAEHILSDIKFPDVYKIDFKCFQNKIEDIESVYNANINKLLSGEKSFSEVFVSLINKDSKLFASNEPEGYVFKYKNKIYQLINSSDINRKIDKEKTSYEFLLSNFIKYCKLHAYTDKITQSYTKTVCNLFNDYIINNEKPTKFIENNIDIDSIENPNIGQKFDIGYEYIPDQVTKTLCQESELYKNIFKVLLANLRKGKDFTHCIYLTKKEVDEWNVIMKNIKIRTLYI